MFDNSQLMRIGRQTWALERLRERGPVPLFMSKLPDKPRLLLDIVSTVCRVVQQELKGNGAGLAKHKSRDQGLRES